MVEEETKILNTCQYWIEDEPVQCTNWDDVNKTCKYPNPDDKGVYALFYPYCNGIGTAVRCNKYEGAGTKARCILPDPNRHVCNRKTGEKWSREEINGYNDGDCDDNGTDTTCSGYSSYHMAFGPLQPTGDEAFDADGFSTIDEIGYRPPLNFEIYNLRAKLGRCYWWKDEVVEFSINSTTGEIEPIEFKCTNPDEMTNEFANFKRSDELGMNRAPCNGCKPECPGYTGICWEHCIDEKMRQGDKVLAEQVLELRYYLRKDAWSSYEYQESFMEPNIKAWAGQPIHTEFDEYGREINWIIDAIHTSITNFETFEITRKKIPLTAGTQANDYIGHYPTMVRELKDLNLRPIIRNKFDENEAYLPIFEVTKIKDKYIRIFGDVFYYGSKAYAINLSDPELAFLPPELKYYYSIAEIEAAYTEAKNPEGFEKFYNNLGCLLENLMMYRPEKIVESEISGENSFYMDVETFFGDNEIVVFDKGSGAWEYDKVYVKKILCNGVIGQTGFSIEGSGGVINYLPAYENDFAAYTNKNGLISFQFFPFLSEDGGASIDYVYNDSVRERLAANPLNPPTFDTYEMGYELFRVKIFDRLELTKENFKIFGNALYVLVTLPDEDKKLSNAVKPWEIDGDISFTMDDGSELKTEVVDREENIAKLEVNQIIIKAKNINKIKQICNDNTLNIGPIYNYEKRSFSEKPADTYEEVNESFVGVDDVVSYRSEMKLEQKGNVFELTDFGYTSLIMSVIFRGTNGRIKGQTKTKMIAWVRQPYCRDVEITYLWGALYNHYKLLPEYNLYGPRGRGEEYAVIGGYTPSCGDHDLSFWSGQGPMWYPYESCEDYARYNITGNLTEYDTSIMEVFNDPENPHGYWDLRMLGPADNAGYTCGTHATWYLCVSDWSFCNEEKKGSNYFTGSGRYRGVLSVEDKIKCLSNDGTLPKFGSVYRDFLRSFRSMDNIDYYYSSGQQVMRRRKWVPMPEFYTAADITAGINNYPFHSYSSSDYYDDNGSFAHPMGLMTVLSDIENVMINEKIDVDISNSPRRYRFEEVFDPHHSLAGLYYPYPKNLYQKLVGGNLLSVVSWYTYKDCPTPGAGLDESTQWAWQEIWKGLERAVPNIASFSCIDSGDMECCVQGSIDDYEISDPYYLENSNIYGKHTFLNIEHPEYKYDMEMAEHRLVCSEGNHVITLLCPSFSIDEEGNIDEYFAFELDTGPQRLFDIGGNWDPDNNHEYYNLYNICTQSPWSTTVSLFATGYNDSSEAVAEADGRMILTYDGLGEEVKEYYQRGLNVAVLTNKFDYLPTKTEFLSSDNYNVKLDTMPDEASEDIVVGEWYQLPPCFDIQYNCGAVDNNDYVAIEFKIRRESSDDALDSGIGAVGKIKCQFKFGAEKSEEEAPKGVWFGNLYHIPAMKVYVNDELLYECDKMHLATKDVKLESKGCTYDLELDANDIFDMKKEEANKRREIIAREASGKSAADIDTSMNVKIEFRTAPTTSEVDEESGLWDHYNTANKMVKIECIYLYHTNFIDAKEEAVTYERKYNVSYGKHGDFPPHGYDSTGSLLYTLPNDKSTVYQNDSIGGVIGMPNSSNDCETMNKCRGRILKECHADKEMLDIQGGGGISWLRGAEQEQKKIHDAVAIHSGGTTFSMRSICPPGLQEYLNKAGTIFPSWPCYFVNSLVLPLAQVIPREMYSPGGHLFVYDDSETQRIPNCGKYGRIFWRSTEDVFEYAYARVVPGGVYTKQIDALDAWEHSIIGRAAIDPMSYLGAGMSRTEYYEQSIRSINSQQTAPESGSYNYIDPLN